MGGWRYEPPGLVEIKYFRYAPHYDKGGWNREKPSWMLGFRERKIHPLLSFGKAKGYCVALRVRPYSFGQRNKVKVILSWNLMFPSVPF